MSRMSIDHKLTRVLRFLMGLHNPRVAEAMGRYGFTQADHDEGWKLLRRAAGELLAVPVKGAKPSPGDLDLLDDWENLWFPIAAASLKRRYPAVHDALFLNLSQTEGPDLIISVGTFIKRLEAMATNDEKARALLAKRGLTDAEVAKASTVLNRFSTVADAPAVNLEQARADRDAAEAEVWDYYLEWGAVARAGIKNGRLLQALGFRRGGSKKKGGEPESEVELANGDGAEQPASE